MSILRTLFARQRVYFAKGFTGMKLKTGFGPETDIVLYPRVAQSSRSEYTPDG